MPAFSAITRVLAASHGIRLVRYTHTGDSINGEHLMLAQVMQAREMQLRRRREEGRRSCHSVGSVG